MILHDSGQSDAVGRGLAPILSPRQMEVIAIIADGKSEKQTGLLLSISRDTVHRHIVNACRRNNYNRIQLIVAFAKWQAIEEGKEQ